MPYKTQKEKAGRSGCTDQSPDTTAPPSQGGGFELIRLRTGLVLSGRDAQNNEAQIDQMGHLKTPSVVPSSVETSPALKQPASPGGILEPMWVVKLFELCAPVVKTTTKAASESRVTSNTRIEERGKPQVWASHPAKCDGT